MVAVLVEYIRSLNQFEIEVEVRSIILFLSIKLWRKSSLRLRISNDVMLGTCT